MKKDILYSEQLLAIEEFITEDTSYQFNEENPFEQVKIVISDLRQKLAKALADDVERLRQLGDCEREIESLNEQIASLEEISKERGEQIDDLVRDAARLKIEFEIVEMNGGHIDVDAPDDQIVKVFLKYTDGESNSGVNLLVLSCYPNVARKVGAAIMALGDAGKHVLGAVR